MLAITKPGLQSTLQGAPRIGYRHLGVPYAGPADDLSMHLANRLVGNSLCSTCLEIAYGGFEADVIEACTIAVTGASTSIEISGHSAPAHETLRVAAGMKITLSPLEQGARTYLAIHTGFVARSTFGSTSTYLPARFGGLQGRTLRTGDVLKPNQSGSPQWDLRTPDELRPRCTDAYALRVCRSGEFERLRTADQNRMFSKPFLADRQTTRMGIPLHGHSLSTDSDGRMQSAPVFPGTIQCPPDGNPVILSCDAQTTGGYPRIGHVARCDRHLLGQIRPGNAIQFLERSPEDAGHDLEQKNALFDQWLHDA